MESRKQQSPSPVVAKRTADYIAALFGSDMTAPSTANWPVFSATEPPSLESINREEKEIQAAIISLFDYVKGRSLGASNKGIYDPLNAYLGVVKATGWTITFQSRQEP